MLLLVLLGVPTLLRHWLQLDAAVCSGNYPFKVSLWAHLLILVMLYLPSSLLGVQCMSQCSTA